MLRFIASNMLPFIKSIYARLVGDIEITDGKIIDSSKIVQTDDIIKPEVVKSIDVKPTVSSNTVIPKIENIVDIDVIPDDVISVKRINDIDVVMAQPPLDIEVTESKHENDSSVTEIIKPDAPTIEGK